MRSILTLKRLLLAFSMIFALCTLACGFEDDEPEPDIWTEPERKGSGEACSDHGDCESYQCECVFDIYYICIDGKACI